MWFNLLLVATAVLLAYGASLGYFLLDARLQERFVPAALTRGSLSAKRWSTRFNWGDYWHCWAWAISVEWRIGSVMLLAMMSFPLAVGFLVYHVYLIWAGMTTNESAKWSDWKEDILDGVVYRARVAELRETYPRLPVDVEPREEEVMWPRAARARWWLVRMNDGRQPTVKEKVDESRGGAGADEGVDYNEVPDERWERVHSLGEVENVYDLGFWGNLRDGMLNRGSVPLITHTSGCLQMAPRPAKRQRRSTIVLSDDSDEDNERPSSEARKSSLQREITLDGRTSQAVSPVKSAKGRAAVRKQPAPKPSPKSSPEKIRKNTRSQHEPDKTKSLHSFFNKATDEERWRKKSVTPDLDIQNGELGDAIEDDELSDETLQELGLKTDTASVVLDKRKPVVTAINGLKSTSDGGGLPSSQRFVRPTLPRPTLSNRNLPSDTEHSLTVEGHRPWADRYGPSNLEELVVHKRKVGDVQNWLQGKIAGRNGQKLLVLKGPAGSGKTTTLSLLAQAMGLQLVHWHNPAVSEAGANNSTALQFEEFLNRGGQFGSLAFDRDSMTSDTSKTDSAHRVLVIEEFPATMTRLHSFRSAVLQYLARSRAASTITLRGQQSPSDNPPPVVLIISETLLSSSTALTDSFTAHRLLGPEILNHPYVTVMEFNPVAPTFVTKALDLVMKKEARDSRRRRMPGPAVIQRLADMGDVRSAVNSLEFLCLRGGDGLEWSGTVAAKAKKSSKDTVPLTEMERNSLQLVSQRETTLDMFHAAGKIVYNKREDPRVLDTRGEPPPKPPDHLRHIYPSKVSQIDIEALLNETGTDIQTFISTLHENYILSCNGETFEESFDGCSDILSISDILNPDSGPRRRANPSHYATMIQANLQAGSSDTLRQDEISFQVATRGLLFNLPYPVNRATPPGAKKSDTFKMFYPASLRLWKPTEELDSLIEMFVYGEGMGKLDAAAAGSNTLSNIPGINEGGVATWRTRTFAAAASSPEAWKGELGADFGHNQEQDDDDDDESVALPPRPLRHAKDTLTLEILPYMTQIFGARKRDTSIIERITKFRPAAAFQSAAAVATGSGAFDDDGDESTAGAGAGENTARARARARAGVFARTPVGGAGANGPPAVVSGVPRVIVGSGLGASTLSGSTSTITGSYDAQSASAVDAASMEKLYISDDDIEDD
ncbi:RFC checkpoint protein Rad17 [Exophiala xenobiotica]|nr:RFC checkpoint protein Rad17 [Exophiala xenobiotica]KAK5345696.1 RFC checkpoint protein Rad17 [Exophiala xenobiotica]KAK5402676.1 RFC checkpoint protein Rad17 [Exophiala xenobiotica]KAK5418274.1 RFC checkpoint protein Rad17 [Exophiala xenobiotica]KAK5418909.1 RFC checkpoint protein Rad17 [Exophiala xenobiotica]